MSADYIRRENQILFLNSERVRGVQNLSFDYSINGENFTSLGADSFDFSPSRPRVGSFNVNSLLISQDPFISFTGLLPITGVVLESIGSKSKNYSFTSGYLTKYSSSCQVGEIPSVSASFDIFGELGRLEASNLNNYTLNETLSLQKTSSDDIFFDFTNQHFSSEKIISYSLDIVVNRRADYVLGNPFPKSIDNIWPIEINFSVTISAADYNGYKLTSFPDQRGVFNLNFTINSESSNNPLASYNFQNMTLISESRSGENENLATVTLNYKGFISSRNYISTDGLVMFLDSQHESSYETLTIWKSLTNEEQIFTILNNSHTPESQRIIFGDTQSYAYSNAPLSIRKDKGITFCLWCNSNNYTGGENGGLGGAILWWGADSSGNGIGIGDTSSYVHFRKSSTDYNLVLPPNDLDWVHYAFCLSIEDQKIYTYANGILQSSIDCPLSSSDFDFNPLYLGYGHGDILFSGYIDKICIYDKILNSTEVLQNFNSTFIKHDISYLN